LFVNSNIIINLAVILALFIIIEACSSDDQNFELASFNDGNIVFKEYLDHYLLSKQYKPDEFPTVENLKEIVLNKAMEKISIPEALAQGIDKDSLYITVQTNNERRILYQKYIEEEASKKIITDSLITEFYNNFTPQYRMRYIMRPFLRNSSESFISSQKEMIEKAYSELENGSSFEDVVTNYSQDISTNKKGGDLGWVIRESMGDEALRLVMDTLKDSHYSKPFKGYGGYYILYKGEKRDVEVPSFESVKSKIWKSLFQSRKAFIEDIVEQRFVELSAKYNFNKAESKINDVLTKISPDGELTDSTPLNFGNLSSKDNSIKIANYDGGYILLSDLFADRKKAPTNREEFFKRFNSISQQHLFAKHAREINLHKDVELSKQLDKMKKSLLRTILYQREVKDKVEETLSTLVGLQSKDKVRKRAEIENNLRTEFENKMKLKYDFSFEEGNFSKALRLASIKKEEQNKAKSKTN
jgi:parvulin-like peptidyl-prolyl isomerase